MTKKGGGATCITDFGTHFILLNPKERVKLLISLVSASYLVPFFFSWPI